MKHLRIYGIIFLGAAILILNLPSRAIADDVITLTDGTKVKGVILTETGDSVKIRLATSGIVNTLAKKEIDTIERGPDARKEFDSRFEKAKKDKSADALYELGAWVSTRIPELADKCFAAALEIYPDHPKTHERLGEERTDGKWVKKPAGRDAVQAVKPAEKAQKPADKKPDAGEKESADFDASAKKEKITKSTFKVETVFKDDGEKKDWIEKTKREHGFAACVETKYYFIFSQGDSGEAAAYGKMMDKMCERWKQIFDFTGALPNKMPIWIFKDQQTFMRASSQPQYAGGFYNGQQLMTFRQTHGGPCGLSTQEVLFHEGTHQFENLMLSNMIKEIDRIGTWLLEGLAVYFEPTTVQGNDVTTNAIPESRYGELRAMVLQNSGMKLRELISTPQAQYVGKHYAYGWGLVYFMLNYSDGKYKKKFNQYWKFITDGGTNSVENFEKTTGLSADKLNDEFHAYYRAGVK